MKPLALMMMMAAFGASLAGCVSGPVPGNPLLVRRPADAPPAENPVFVPQGGEGYGLVFDRTYDVVAEYFDISHSNRFDGRIETWPLMAAGYAEPWRLGLYDSYANTHALLQTIRRRAEVTITTAKVDGYDVGGFYIDVKVYKELENLPQPTHSSTGAAAFRTENAIERQYEVVEPTVVSHGWIPAGRDHCLEQVILHRLKNCL